MRRNLRRERKEKNHNLFYIGGSIVLIGLIAFAVTFVVYGNKMDKQANIDSQKIASLVKESTTDSAEVSTKVGKTVEESQNEIQKNTSKSTQNTIDNTTTKATNSTNTTKIEESTKTQDTTKKEETKKEETKKEENKKVETKKEDAKPVDGEIIKEYAKDNLVYSETLEEWTNHLGWDIKADKTTVVKSSAIGKVKSIKNDPRYGLSIIIEHQDGYETLYSNLLSTEFVTVGEEVKQGQSIGTVGNTAAFEIADTAHLHFEITKNGENVDPSTLVK